MKKCNICKYVAALCLLAVCMLFDSFDVSAKPVSDEKYGLSYEDTYYISSGYAYNSYYGGACYCAVNLTNANYRIKNVKSKSKNLLVKKTRENYSTRTTSSWNDELKKYEYETKTLYGTSYISFFGKKKGKYTVTFDIVDSKGKVQCTKKIKVYVDKKADQVTYQDPIKSIKYAGKEIWEYGPFVEKTSGKLKVKLNKNFSLVSIQVGTYNSKGQYVQKKIKNGKKITLSKKRKSTVDYGNEKHIYNDMLPETRILICVKNKKTKMTYYVSHTLYTLNMK